ncbi:hypothetical protein DITRI_Ditri08aG0052700 [Diplodiscus trichospermus]
MASRVLSTTLVTPPCSTALNKSRILAKKNKSRIKPSTNSEKQFLCSSSSASDSGVRNGKIKSKAVSESSQGSIDRTVYQGAFGPWTVDPEDVREVVLYRSGLVTCASSFVIAASAAYLPENFASKEIIEQNLDLFYLIGAGGLGLSLYLIHIYVTEIKRTLQALWVLGGVGSLATYVALAQPAGDHLVHYVLYNPMAVWFVGPFFAALTGLVFKEGLCYGKLEAGILTFVIPTLLLGHLDDIGDKSVFMFNSLPEDEKKALIEKLEQQKLQSDSQEVTFQ